MTEKSIQLPCGRRLAYNLYGPADGRPVLYFHGTPSSRLEPLLPSIYGVGMITLLERHKLHLVSIDRPGMGFSDFHPEGTFITFAHNVSVLLKHLHISRCPVLCWSGGGPYALAIAHQFPALIQSVFMIAGFTTSLATPGAFEQMKRNKYYFSTAKNTPDLLKFILDYVAKMEIKTSFMQAVSGLPDVDYAYMKDVHQLKQLAAITLQEACRYGSGAAVKEAAGYFNEFGFSLSDIFQPVHYWWGTEDSEITAMHPQAIEQQAPNNKVYYKEGEGHISIYVRHIEEVLQAIAGIDTDF